MSDTLRAVRWSDVQQHLNGANADVQAFLARVEHKPKGAKKATLLPSLLEDAFNQAALLQPGLTSSGSGGPSAINGISDPTGRQVEQQNGRDRDPDLLAGRLADAARHALTLTTLLGLRSRTDDPTPRPGTYSAARDHLRTAAAAIFSATTLGEAKWRDTPNQAGAAKVARALATSLLDAKAAAWRLTTTTNPADAPADRHGCRSCERIKDGRGRAMWSEPRVDGGTLCRWCEDQNTARGNWPPEAIVRLHHDGKRITEEHYEAAAKEAKQAKKKGKR